MITWDLDRKECLRYLGYRQQVLSPQMILQIDRCGDELKAAATPQTVYRIWDADQFPEMLIEGKSIRKHLQGAEKIALMAATIGAEVDLLLRRKTAQNISDALIVDAWATTAVEEVCDRWQQELQEKYQKENLIPGSRFSPGYGDYPLHLQKEILSILNTERRIGVKLTSSGLMTPTKTVTAVVPLRCGKGPENGCADCDAKEHCAYRKEADT